MLKQRGFTLVELMVALSILAFSLAMVAPSFSIWVQNSKLRSYAESLQNALQFARSEAVRRNTTISLQITDTLDNACTALATGIYWVTTAGPQAAVGACGNALSTDAQATSAAISAGVAGPFILQKGPVETSLNSGTTIALTAVQPANGAFTGLISFNGLGRLVAPNNFLTQYQIIPAAAIGGQGACAPAGNIRCLNLVVQPAGQVRMCDPSLPAGAANDPMAC